MSRKHFEKLAAIIKSHMITLVNLNVCWSIANDIADMCQEENPRFDRDKFLKACGLK